MKLSPQLEFLIRDTLRTPVKKREFHQIRRFQQVMTRSIRDKIDNKIEEFDKNLNICQDVVYGKINEQVR